MKSILFPEADAQLVRSYNPEQLQKSWLEQYGLDVSLYFQKIKEVNEYRCLHSGLYFYRPASLAGNSAFYSHLMKFSWYYLPDKWEYKTSLRLLNSGMKILEIGSGSGAFLQKCMENNIHATGLEMNESAINIGKRQGLNLIFEDLFVFSGMHEGVFDAVVSFQVMEHISDPLPFLQASLHCLKPGGIFIISVPNSDLEFIRRHSILNAPPHHMLGWTSKSLAALEQLLPLKLKQVLNEPLAIQHIDWYLGILQQQNFWVRQWLRWPFLRKITSKFLSLGAKKWVKGHTHLAWYLKTEI